MNVAGDSVVKVCHAQSLKLTYELSTSGYMWVARGFDLDVKGAAAWLVRPEDVSWARYNALSIFMYGSETGAVIAFDIKDSGGEMWRFLLDDDYKGWKEIICPFNNFFLRKDWQPEQAVLNEQLDMTVSI